MSKKKPPDAATNIILLALMIGLAVTAIAIIPVALIVIAPLVFLLLFYQNMSFKIKETGKKKAIIRQAKRDLKTISEDEIKEQLGHAGVSIPLFDIGVKLVNECSVIPNPPANLNSIEGGRYLDRISKMDHSDTIETVAELLSLFDIPSEEGDLTVRYRDTVDVADKVQDVFETVFSNKELSSLKRTLNKNYKDLKSVDPYKADGDVVFDYLKGTPLKDIFDIQVSFNIPEQTRMEHTHLVGGSGAGKTQTIQYLISQDLEHLGDRSVVVIDSQGDLINTILKLDIPYDKIVYINPEDIEYPVCLNLFSIGQDRFQEYSLVERERLTNSIIELYDYMFASLLDASLTQKQGVVFRYACRLLVSVPNASIVDLRRVLEPNGLTTYREHINRLDGTVKHFFENEFDTRDYVQTRTQILRRLYGILENQTFERMFAHTHSKLDLFNELNIGKLILINTSKSLLKENGTQIFGRFFISLITQAAQERAVTSDRLPVHVYIDEAQDYFDHNISIILSQARKYNIGMMLAHQYIGQLDPKLQEAVSANTSIKMAGGVSAKDARVLAPQLYCSPEFVQKQPKGHFATYVKGTTDAAVSLRIPFGVLEKLPKRTDMKDLTAYMRDRYSEKPTKAPERAQVMTDDVEEQSAW